MDSTFLIKNARIIDPGQQIDRITNIAVVDGKVHSLGDNIDLEINSVLDARECIVTPGWIDSHVHCYEHSTPLGINVDKYCLARGVTTVVDAGSAGSDTFPGLQKFIIEQSKTRVYALLHIAAHGLASAGCASEGPGGECDSLHQVDTEKCLSRILECHDQIVGVKVRLQAAVAAEGKNETEIYRRALDCAKRANVPLMTHHVESTVPTQRRENENKGEEMGCPANLRPGDIYTHCFHGWRNSILDNRLGKLTIHPDVLEAKERGVYFDVGHGWGSFHWGVAEQCAKSGFFPDTISTDIHMENINGPVYDMATVMSKLLCVGMPINEVIKAVTETPANAIRRAHLIGSLRVGRDADITMCRIEECNVEMEDCCGQIRKLKQRIAPLKVWRAGKEYSIIDIEAWPNKANWLPLASNLDKIEIKDSEKPYYLQ